ncbi:hypothetical protein [Angustibacter luteus]|uniref:FlgD Ig-like domain-containing protein n=1 Tax=Angustibacter luteus TaxID=658456 RepID=A0ABW1JF63_9ACTN
MRRSSVLAVVAAGVGVVLVPLATPVRSARADVAPYPPAATAVADPVGTQVVPRRLDSDPVPSPILAASAANRLLQVLDVKGCPRLAWQQHDQASHIWDDGAACPQVRGVWSSEGRAVVDLGAPGSVVLADLSTGSASLVERIAGATMLAATPDGWVDWDAASASVVRHHLDGTSESVPLPSMLGGDLTLPPQPPTDARGPAAADATGVVAVLDFSGRARLVWLPFDGSTATALTSGLAPEARVWVTEHSVVWRDSATTSYLARRPKTGGTSVFRSVGTGVQSVAVDDVSWAWTSRDASGVRHGFVAGLDRTLPPVRIGDLPATSVASDGTDYWMTVGAQGRPAEVYRVSRSGVSDRVADLGPAWQRVRELAFDGSNASWLVAQPADQAADQPVSSVLVPASGAVGAEVRTLSPAADETSALSGASGRLAFVGAGPEVSVVDLTPASPVLVGSFAAGGATGPVPDLTARTVLVNGAMRDFAGTSYGNALGAVTGALFGRSFVWSTDDGAVWRRVGAGNVVPVLPAVCSTHCPARVGIWGDTAVVQPASGPLLVVSLRTGERRELPAIEDLPDPAGSTAGPRPLELEDGVLAWVAPTGTREGTVRLMDLRASEPRPVDVARAIVLPGQASVQLAGGKVAWVGLSDGAIRLAPAAAAVGRPVGAALVDSSVPPSAFSPNGDGRSDTWSAAGEASAPLASVRMELRRGTTLVASVPGTSTAGRWTVRWDGRSSSGAWAADSPYTWRLVATAVNGQPVLDPATGAPPSGTVNLRRVLPRVTITAPAVSATAVTGIPFPVRWGTTTTQPSWSPVTYQVRVRPYWDGGPVVGTAPWRYLPATTATRTTFDYRRYADTLGWPEPAWQLQARAVAPGGATGPWSASAYASVPVDDAQRGGGAVRYYGSWTAQRVAGAFLGTQHRTSARGASVYFRIQNRAGHVSAVMTTCPACGRVRVWVDNAYPIYVDTYSRTVGRRKVVLTRTTRSRNEPYVTIENLATRGRPFAYVDAVAFQP